MKKYISIAILLLIVVSMASCGTAAKIEKDNTNQFAGYTLKNKKELMQQKIACKKSKTILTTP